METVHKRNQTLILAMAGKHVDVLFDVVRRREVQLFAWSIYIFPPELIDFCKNVVKHNNH